jgi:hypothetical protein
VESVPAQPEVAHPVPRQPVPGRGLGQCGVGSGVEAGDHWKVQFAPDHLGHGQRQRLVQRREWDQFGQPCAPPCAKRTVATSRGRIDGDRLPLGLTVNDGQLHAGGAGFAVSTRTTASPHADAVAHRGPAGVQQFGPRHRVPAVQSVRHDRPVCAHASGAPTRSAGARSSSAASRLASCGAWPCAVLSKYT